jgi:hypothetical protein
MVLARVRIREDLVADISDARPQLRIVLGETERLEIVSSKDEVTVVKDGEETILIPQEMVVIRCKTPGCGRLSVLEFNMGCPYCGRGNTEKPQWGDTQLVLVPKP